MQAFDPDSIAPRRAHFIGGVFVEAPPGGVHIDVARPSDGRPYAAVPCADADLVDRAARNAAQAFLESTWARCAPRERARVLGRWADLIAADTALLAPLEAVGSTRPLADVERWDIPFTAEGIRFYAELADKIGGDLAPTQSNLIGMTVAEPYGVIGAIAPWNFPLVMANWKIAPALAAGNAVVLKPSEMTPFSALRLAELAIQAGMPAGIFNVIQGDGHTTGEALCRHPAIAKVTFTGSTRTGAAIMTACAESGIKPATLELGGKSPQLVFADAPDFERVAQRIAGAITGNAGQVCVAGSRLIVARQIAPRLVDAIAQAMSGLHPGLTWNAATTLSPIISAPQAERIEGLVERARAAGATLVEGGSRAQVAGGGAFYQPTILADVDENNEAVREEIFGPVLTVQTFEDEDQAFALADHPRYGLASGVHTADLGRALRAARRLAAGTVWINRYGRSADFILPTGGYKGSGIGKDLGRQAYEANLRFKTVLIDIGQA